MADTLWTDLPETIQVLICEKLLIGDEGNAGNVLRLSSVRPALLTSGACLA